MEETRNFKEAYGVLQRHAETPRRQSEPDIDDLLRIVNESVQAYNVCKSRIDAVERALEAALAAGGARQESPGPAPVPGEAPF